MTRSRPIAYGKSCDPMLQDDDPRSREYSSCLRVLGLRDTCILESTLCAKHVCGTCAGCPQSDPGPSLEWPQSHESSYSFHELTPTIRYYHVWCCVVCWGGWSRQRSGTSRHDVCAHALSMSPSRHSFHSHACARRLTSTCTRRTRDRARTHAHTSAGGHT